jgi:hypothetical protein
MENYITASINFDEVIDEFAEKKLKKFFFLNFEDYVISTFEDLLFNLLLRTDFFFFLIMKIL